VIHPWFFVSGVKQEASKSVAKIVKSKQVLGGTHLFAGGIHGVFVAALSVHRQPIEFGAQEKVSKCEGQEKKITDDE
jgi:hypothetical protein